MATVATLSLPITPPDYHRIISPTLRIPADPSISIPVGILACQRTQFNRSLFRVLIAIELSRRPSSQTNRHLCCQLQRLSDPTSSCGQEGEESRPRTNYSGRSDPGGYPSRHSDLSGRRGPAY